MTFSASGFEQLHSAQADPWSVRTSWYEARKRAITLAMLPHRRYGLAFEPGCSIGELTADLSERCEQLIAWDFSPSALAAAAVRLRGRDNVRLEQKRMPQEWPDGASLDLIVISEVGYFLQSDELQELLERVEQTLAQDGAVILCHWRHPIEHGELDGDAVHACFEHSTQLRLISRLEESDFLISVLTREGRSVGALGGLSP